MNTWVLRFMVLLFILPAFSSSAQQYIPYRRGDLWGLVERGLGAGVVSPKYTSMKPLGNGYFNASQKDSSIIIIDSTGKETINLPYALVWFPGDGLLRYTDKKNGDIWYHVSGRKLNIDKREVKKADYCFGGRLKYTNYAGKKGFLDVHGNVAIKAVYDFASASAFLSGYAIVGIEEKYGAIDSSGNIVIALQYDWVSPLGNGLFFVKKNKKGALADKTNRLLTPFEFNFIDDFSSGIAPATKNGQYLYINEHGKEIWPKGYEKATGFENDIAVVNDGTSYMLINRTGEIVYKVPSIYNVAVSFGGIFFILQHNLTMEYMVIDRTGKVLFTGMHRMPHQATRSYCIVEKGGRYGTINESGIVTIPIVYDRMVYIADIDAWYVEKGSIQGYVDHLGTEYWIGK